MKLKCNEVYSIHELDFDPFSDFIGSVMEFSEHIRGWIKHATKMVRENTNNVELRDLWAKRLEIEKDLSEKVLNFIKFDYPRAVREEFVYNQGDLGIDLRSRDAGDSFQNFKVHVNKLVRMLLGEEELKSGDQKGYIDAMNELGDPKKIKAVEKFSDILRDTLNKIDKLEGTYIEPRKEIKVDKDAYSKYVKNNEVQTRLRPVVGDN